MAKKKCVPSFEKPDVPQESKRKYTEKIVKYRKDLFNREKKLVFCEGLPHTGKTLNAIEAGVEQVMKGIYSKLVIIRPITDNEFGFLPGTAEDKMAFLIRQAREYVNDACMGGWINLVMNRKVEVLPADQLQGNHFRDSFVVVDEAQNIHYRRTFKVLSRLGDNSKWVIIGDTSRGQEHEKIKHNNMLQYSIRKFEGYNHPKISVHSFYDEENDILGDDFTKFIIKTLIPDFVDGEGV